MATITYDRTAVLDKEAADRLVEILERPAVPVSEEAIRRHKESLERGQEWMKQFSNTPKST
ncbi:MAG: hypothetical protein FWG64_01940 [Firmicutes bacterium]|nr:hypothetical protein [Bacillota bacterium]